MFVCEDSPWRDSRTCALLEVLLGRRQTQSCPVVSNRISQTGERLGKVADWTMYMVAVYVENSVYVKAT